MAWWKSVQTDWGKLWSLPSGQRCLLALICGHLLLTIAAVRLLGFRRWQATLARWSRPPSSPVSDANARAMNAARLVHAAARRMVGVDCCLPKALVLWSLLRWRGIDVELRIGVRKRADRLEAHAWVERGGRAVNETAAAAFVPFEQAIVPFGSQTA
jgi:hypothetical protein